MFGRKVNASENIDLVSLERSEAERSEAERSGGLTKSAGSKLRVSSPLAGLLAGCCTRGFRGRTRNRQTRPISRSQWQDR